jgi:hypothetical protein
MRTIWIGRAGAFLCCLLSFPVAAAVGQASPDSQIVEDARTAYYNLHDQGLNEFRCDVRVDWNTGLVSQNGDTAGSGDPLPLLRQTHFAAVVGAVGAPRLSLQFDGAAPSDEMAARLRQASAGVERSLNGVLQELASVLFGSLLPPDRDYHLEAQGDHLRITFGSDEVRIVETMKKDGELEEMIVATQKSTVSVRPQFKRGEKGFLPVVIDSSVEAAGADKVQLHVEIAYQTDEGFNLPQTVSIRDTALSGGAPVQFGFSNYQARR